MRHAGVLPIAIMLVSTSWACSNDGSPADHRAPMVVLGAVPQDPTNAREGTFEFACDEADCHFECSLDDAPFASCASPAAASALADGPHTFAVSATDAAGNVGDAATMTWHIDATPPTVSITAQPSNPTNQRDATIAFTCSEATCSVECSVDGGAAAPCTSPVSYASLADGLHTVSVRATDAVGNTGSADAVWSVDTIAPHATIVSRPATFSTLTTATFGLACDESCSYTCRLDGGAPAACSTSPSVASLSDGWHVLEVVAVDPAGNPSAPRTAVWAVSGAAPTTAVVEVASHVNHTCALHRDGSLWCAGYNGAGQLGDGTTTMRFTPVKVGADEWRTVSVGSGTTCAIKNDGSLWCWGGNSRGQLGDGTQANRATPTRVGTDTWTRVSAGSGHTCAMRSDATAWCWGDNTTGQLGDGTVTLRTTPLQVAGSQWVALEAGDNITCGSQRDGSLWCWGRNSSGQLGNGTTTNASVPTRVLGNVTWEDFAVAPYHVCARRNDGSLWCWGENSYGEVPGAAGTYTPTPTQVGSGTTWATFDAGQSSTCATQTNGTLWCWGRSELGALGHPATGGTGAPPTQVGVDTTWAVVAVGDTHACANQIGGAVMCWGENRYGQLGLGRSSLEPVPTQVGTDTTWTTVDAGAYHTCASHANGAAACWGTNSNGQLGDGTTISHTAPTSITGSWTRLSLGSEHTCGIEASGALACWGWGSVVGVQPVMNRTVPTVVDASASWGLLAAGQFHTSAVRGDGTLWGWGSNSSERLGFSNGGAYQTLPIQIGTNTQWRDVATDFVHGCGTRTDNSIWCWGSNNYGQLGDASTTNRASPVQIGAAALWGAVAAGASHTCALRTDGSLWCWGRNQLGQLGLGDLADRHIPVHVGTDTWKSVVAGGYLACAIRNDDTLWCWGDNSYGQLGDTVTLTKSTPTQIGTGTWSAITVGFAHVCGIKTTGTLWCWGESSYGALSFGDTWSPTPSVL